MCNLDLGFKGYHLPSFRCARRLHRRGVPRAPLPRGRPAAVRARRRRGWRASRPTNSASSIRWGSPTTSSSSGISSGSPRRMGSWSDPGAARRPAASSPTALGITALDPLKYNLIFERFLNPSRISMPDIDIDFADDRRAEVIEYVVDKYGDDRVAQIVTFGTLAAKASVRDVGRAMGMALCRDRPRRQADSGRAGHHDRQRDGEGAGAAGALRQRTSQLRELIERPARSKGSPATRRRTPRAS